jgi:hypothetical protein
VAGSSGGDFVLLRLGLDGSPDMNFGINGVVVTDLGGDGRAATEPSRRSAASTASSSPAAPTATSRRPLQRRRQPGLHLRYRRSGDHRSQG